MQDRAKLMAPMIDGDDNDMGNDEKLENNAVGEFKEFLKMSNIRSGGYFTNQILTWDHIWTRNLSSTSINPTHSSFHYIYYD